MDNQYPGTAVVLFIYELYMEKVQFLGETILVPIRTPLGLPGSNAPTCWSRPDIGHDKVGIRALGFLVANRGSVL